MNEQRPSTKEDNFLLAFIFWLIASISANEMLPEDSDIRLILLGILFIFLLISIVLLLPNREPRE